MQSNLLDSVSTLEAYRQGRGHVFPSGNALEWFIRRNRAELIEAGALVKLKGQWHAVSDKFDSYVLEAGQRKARQSIGQA